MPFLRLLWSVVVLGLALCHRLAARSGYPSHAAARERHAGESRMISSRHMVLTHGLCATSGGGVLCTLQTSLEEGSRVWSQS
jgi:hypothetical protein